MRRIYLDNAATSWPKPDSVYAAVDGYLRENGAPAGRSGYAEAAEASRIVETARRDLARLLGVRQPERLVFTFNGTDALNLAIHGFVRSGDHVVATVVEHNSTLRPLRTLEERNDIAVSRVPCDSHGVVSPDDIRKALTEKTRLVVVSRASNVTGAIQPIEEIREIVHSHGARLLVDEAQSIGHLPLDLDASGVDMAATAGHKGLLGPLGTGLLYLRPGMESEVACQRQGGTGTRSEEDRQPDQLPNKFESGNLNVPGIAGLGAAATHLFKKTISAVREHDLVLTTRMLAGFESTRGVTVFGPPNASDRAGLVSIRIEGYDPQEVAAALDAVHRIQVRPGLHCAPLMHAALGTIEAGGTVRFSFGQFNTEQDVDEAVAAVAELAASGP
jgi:cysteine desulfurase / selenocysteine lyase